MTKTVNMIEDNLPLGGWSLRRVARQTLDPNNKHKKYCSWEIMEVYYNAKKEPIGACDFSLTQDEGANFTKIIGMIQSAQAKPVLAMDSNDNFI